MVVLQAYQAKVLVVNKEINAVCDFIVEATEQAEALALLQEEERGPLHGLLISVKVRKLFRRIGHKLNFKRNASLWPVMTRPLATGN